MTHETRRSANFPTAPLAGGLSGDLLPGRGGSTCTEHWTNDSRGTTLWVSPDKPIRKQVATMSDHRSILSPFRAYARLMALSTLLSPADGARAREAASVLVDAAECREARP